MTHGLADLVTQVTGKAECYVFKCPFMLLTVQILSKLHLRLHELFCLQTCSYAILSTNKQSHYQALLILKHLHPTITLKSSLVNPAL